MAASARATLSVVPPPVRAGAVIVTASLRERFDSLFLAEPAIRAAAEARHRVAIVSNSEIEYIFTTLECISCFVKSVPYQVIHFREQMENEIGRQLGVDSSKVYYAIMSVLCLVLLLLIRHYVFPRSSEGNSMAADGLGADTKEALQSGQFSSEMTLLSSNTTTYTLPVAEEIPMADISPSNLTTETDISRLTNEGGDTGTYVADDISVRSKGSVVSSLMASYLPTKYGSSQRRSASKSKFFGGSQPEPDLLPEPSTSLLVSPQSTVPCDMESIADTSTIVSTNTTTTTKSRKLNSAVVPGTSFRVSMRNPYKKGRGFRMPIKGKKVEV